MSLPRCEHVGGSGLRGRRGDEVQHDSAIGCGLAWLTSDE